MASALNFKNKKTHTNKKQSKDIDRSTGGENTIGYYTFKIIV
jgi:hypothetical protein